MTPLTFAPLLVTVSGVDESVPWPTIFGVVLAVVGGLLSLLITLTGRSASREVERLDKALDAIWAAHRQAAATCHALEVQVGQLASQEMVRTMERDLAHLVRSEVGSLRSDIAALRNEIHSGRAPHTGGG